MVHRVEVGDHSGGSEEAPEEDIPAAARRDQVFTHDPLMLLLPRGDDQGYDRDHRRKCVPEERLLQSRKVPRPTDEEGHKREPEGRDDHAENPQRVVPHPGAMFLM